MTLTPRAKCLIPSPGVSPKSVLLNWAGCTGSKRNLYFLLCPKPYRDVSVLTSNRAPDLYIPSVILGDMHDLTLEEKMCNSWRGGIHAQV